MRRLEVYTRARIIFVSLIACVLLMISAIASMSAHATNTKAQGANCSNSCTSHNQSATLGTHSERKEEDDKEPNPPLALLDSPKIITLGLYGVAYSLILILVYHNRRYLLIQQLRF